MAPRPWTPDHSAQSGDQTIATQEGGGACSQCLLRTTDARGGASFSSQNTPIISQRRHLWWYLQKICPRQCSWVLLPWAALQTGMCVSFWKRFSAGKGAIQTKDVYTHARKHTQTPSYKLVSPWDLLVTQTCYSLFVPSWKAISISSFVKPLLNFQSLANLSLQCQSLISLHLLPLSLHSTHNNVLKMCMLYNLSLYWICGHYPFIQIFMGHLWYGRPWTRYKSYSSKVPYPLRIYSLA